MTCPKCESANVLAAPDEAPPRARQWMKCWACGKRWDQAGAMLSTGNDESEDEQDDESTDPPPVRRKRTVDELMSILNTVVKDARARRGEPTKEDDMGSAMNGICSKKTCEEPSAPDSVMCVKHRDQKKASNDAQRDRRLKLAVGGGAVSKETKTPARRGPKPKVKETLPAVRSPHVVEAVPVSVGELDSALMALEADRAILERAKQILERMRG